MIEYIGLYSKRRRGIGRDPPHAARPSCGLTSNDSELAKRAPGKENSALFNLKSADRPERWMGGVFSRMLSLTKSLFLLGLLGALGRRLLLFGFLLLSLDLAILLFVFVTLFVGFLLVDSVLSFVLGLVSGVDLVPLVPKSQTQLTR